ncbi:MAG: YqhV family protein [Eubacteriales bacterium]|nr:YqhV family protein [Bacillota bacterium]
MFLVKDKVVFGMAMMRFLSSIIEFSAAVMFLKFDSIEKALKINAVLALIGPTVMTVVMALGLAGMSGKVSAGKFLIILAGVALIFYGAGRGR